jgi:hypothetical protein
MVAIWALRLVAVVLIVFLLRLTLKRPFSLVNGAYNMLVIGYLIYGMVKSHRNMTKRLKYTKLEIVGSCITLTVPSLPTLQTKFSDIKRLDINKHGLSISAGREGKKVVMITNKFEGFDEIEAKICAAVPRDLIKTDLELLLQQA